MLTGTLIFLRSPPIRRELNRFSTVCGVSRLDASVHHFGQRRRRERFAHAESRLRPTRARRRLLTIGHSYCVAVNRRLAHEMAREGGQDWEVTAVAPEFFHGDLRPIRTERISGELCRLETVPAFLSNRIHFFFYGRKLREILSRPWDVVHCWEEPYIVAGGQIAWWTPPSDSAGLLDWSDDTEKLSAAVFRDRALLRLALRGLDRAR